MLVLRVIWFQSAALIASKYINASNFVDATFCPCNSSFYSAYSYNPIFLFTLPVSESFNPYRLSRPDIKNMSLRSPAPPFPAPSRILGPLTTWHRLVP